MNGSIYTTAKTKVGHNILQIYEPEIKVWIDGPLAYFDLCWTKLVPLENCVYAISDNQEFQRLLLKKYNQYECNDLCKILDLIQGLVYGRNYHLCLSLQIISVQRLTAIFYLSLVVS